MWHDRFESVGLAVILEFQFSVCFFCLLPSCYVTLSVYLRGVRSSPATYQNSWEWTHQTKYRLDYSFDVMHHWLHNPPDIGSLQCHSQPCKRYLRLKLPQAERWGTTLEDHWLAGWEEDNLCCLDPEKTIKESLQLGFIWTFSSVLGSHTIP